MSFGYLLTKLDYCYEAVGVRSIKSIRFVLGIRFMHWQSLGKGSKVYLFYRYVILLTMIFFQADSSKLVI